MGKVAVHHLPAFHDPRVVGGQDIYQHNLQQPKGFSKIHQRHWSHSYNQGLGAVLFILVLRIPPPTMPPSLPLSVPYTQRSYLSLEAVH